jgi:hypothetical protein
MAYLSWFTYTFEHEKAQHSFNHEPYSGFTLVHLSIFNGCKKVMLHVHEGNTRVTSSRARTKLPTNIKFVPCASAKIQKWKTHA